MEYGVTTRDIRFESIMVRDEVINKEKDDKKEMVFTYIPVLAKSFKIIIQNLSHHLEQNRQSHEVFH